MKYAATFIICFLLGGSLSVVSHAQTNIIQSNSGQFNIRKWNEKNGLGANVYAMCQSADGYLWIGNEYGITRFDGMQTLLINHKTSKEIKEDFCRVLYFSNDCTMYCGMMNGVVLVHKNNHFTQLGSCETFYEKSIHAICEDKKGNIWIVPDGNGLVEYSNGRFFNFRKSDGLFSDNIRSVTRGNNNDVWIGSDAGLNCIRDGKIIETNTQSKLLSKDITAVGIFPGNILLAGSADGKITLIRNEIVDKDLSGTLGNGSPISSIHAEPGGKIWIGTEGDGLFFIDLEQKKINHITTSDSLSSTMVTSILTNSEGDLMVGTQGNGLNRLRKKIVQTYSKKDGLAENVILGMCRTPDGTILIGHETGGITQYVRGKFTDISSKFGIKQLPVFSVSGDAAGKFHIATSGSLITWDGKNRSIFKAHGSLDNTKFTALCVDRNGTLWAGTNAGIYMFRGKEVKTISERDGLSDVRIFCFLEDHLGRMWVGTQEGGLCVIKDGKISVLNKKNGLADNMILSMYEDAEGTMWIGTGNNGLNRIDGKTGKISFLDSLDLQQTAICQIMEDDLRNLWIGTTYGIFVVKRDEINGYVNGLNKLPHINCFGEEEGVPAGCVGGVFPAGCITTDKKLWFSTTAGIAEIDPRVYSLRLSSPKVSIETIKVNNRIVDKGDSYNLPSGVIHLEINYTAPSFIAPEKLTYRYKLEGYDNEWIEAGERTFAMYTKVPQGDYIFKVEVRNYQGIVSQQQASVKIHINPFFYQTWWFRMMCLTSALMILFGIYIFRIRQVRDKELEILVIKRTNEISKLNESLEQKVVDRTAQLAATNMELEAFSYSVSHDLKAPVRRIEGLIQALTEDYHEQLDENAKDFLNKISESAASMSVLIDELLKLSRIARQELDKSEINLSGMASDVNEKQKRNNPGRNVKVNIEPGMIVEADARLVQIALQNLFDNAWKYTGKTPEAVIDFGMIEKDGKQAVFIRDNGAGFDMGHYGKLFTPFQRLHSDDQFTGTGIGLATVRRIIVKHGGWIKADSEPGKGATFYFTFS